MVAHAVGGPWATCGTDTVCEQMVRFSSELLPTTSQRSVAPAIAVRPQFETCIEVFSVSFVTYPNLRKPQNCVRVSAMATKA